MRADDQRNTCVVPWSPMTCAYVRGIDGKMPPEMHTKAKAVEERAWAQHAFSTACLTRNVVKRIRRIGDRYQHRVRRSAYDLRDNVAINGSVLFQKPEPTLWIAAVGCTAALFVNTRSDEHHASSGERV